MTRYSQDFKEKLIEEVKEVKSIRSVSAKHNIPTSTLATWIKKSHQNIQLNFERSKKDLKSENKQLKRQLEDVELELAIIKDLLKKNYQS